MYRVDTTVRAVGITVALTVCLSPPCKAGWSTWASTALHPPGFIFAEVVRADQNRATRSPRQHVPVCVCLPHTTTTLVPR